MDNQEEDKIKKILSVSRSGCVCVLVCFGEIFHDSLWFIAGLTKHSEGTKEYNYSCPWR